MRTYVLKLDEYLEEPIQERVIEGLLLDVDIPVDIGDDVALSFREDKAHIMVKIFDHYCRKIKELTLDEALKLGYGHSNLLKQELSSKHPKLSEEDYVHYYTFEII